MTTLHASLGLANADLLASGSLGCPACFGTATRGQQGYYVATGLLLAVPMIVLAAATIWIRRSQRRLPASPPAHREPGHQEFTEDHRRRSEPRTPVRSES